MVKKREVRGDKLRRIILFIYLHNKFSKDKVKVADLKKTIGYSAGGVYGAFESVYLEKGADDIHLTDEGKRYVKERILPQFGIFKSYGNVLLILGFFFFVQWFEWTYFSVPVIPSWYFAVLILGFGFVLRFFVLRLDFIIMKRRKKMDQV